MNLEPLKRVFRTEAATNTGTVLTLPSSLTKDLAKELVGALPLDTVIQGLAVIAAKELGTKLLAMSLRPSDYSQTPDLPDELIERLIEALAKKPDLFFKTFQDNLQLQG